MKNFKTITLTAVACLLLACSCETPEPPYTLPPITQEGANTFGCKIDGEVWIPFGGAPLLHTNPEFYFAEGGFQILVAQRGDNEYTEFLIDFTNTTQVGKYYLNFSENFVHYTNHHDSCYFESDTAHYSQNTRTDTIGWLEITRIDTVNKFVSGLFEFELTKSNLRFSCCNGHCPNNIKITDGRFDLLIWEP